MTFKIYEQIIFPKICTDLQHLHNFDVLSVPHSCQHWMSFIYIYIFSVVRYEIATQTSNLQAQGQNSEESTFPLNTDSPTEVPRLI